MPILAYCMTSVEFSMQLPLTGVHGAAVEAVEAGGVHCFYSRLAEEHSSARGGAQDGALAFHRVLQELFAHTAILPFRFPTVLEGEPELIAHLQEHAVEYRTALARLRELVQMEIRITSVGERSKEEAKASGAQYLRSRLAQQQKLEAAAESVQKGAGSFLRGWRQRESKDGLRCFMLMGRGDVSQLKVALSGVQLPADLTARVSGPWPATEFVKQD